MCKSCCMSGSPVWKILKNIKIYTLAMADLGWLKFNMHCCMADRGRRCHYSICPSYLWYSETWSAAWLVVIQLQCQRQCERWTARVTILFFYSSLFTQRLGLQAGAPHAMSMPVGARKATASQQLTRWPTAKCLWWPPAATGDTVTPAAKKSMLF